MTDGSVKFSCAVRTLMANRNEMVHAKDIAPILGMRPDVIIKKVKSGLWDSEKNGNYITSGRCVKFYRIDFLRKGGWIQ